MDDTRRMSLRSPVRRMSMASRVSMAPNGGQNTSTSLRMSMAGSMQRRCGLKLLVIIYRKTSIPDPAGFNGQRNLDKENLGSNIKHIIEFLSFHNYNQEVSASTLRQLKDSDFESIVRFILRHIDPNLRIDQNVKGDFPRIMSMLGYIMYFKSSPAATITRSNAAS